MLPPAQVLKRIAITLALGVAFIGMASIFTPERSRAGHDWLRQPLDPRPPQGEPPMAAISTNAHEGLHSLGVVEAGRYAITIYSTDAGPRYTIILRDSGEEIGTLLSPAQIELLMPEVDLNAIDFSAPTNASERILMLAEPQA